MHMKCSSYIPAFFPSSTLKLVNSSQSTNPFLSVLNILFSYISKLLLLRPLKTGILLLRTINGALPVLQVLKCKLLIRNLSTGHGQQTSLTSNNICKMYETKAYYGRTGEISSQSKQCRNFTWHQNMSFKIIFSSSHSIIKS